MPAMEPALRRTLIHLAIVALTAGFMNLRSVSPMLDTNCGGTRRTIGATQRPTLPIKRPTFASGNTAELIE